MARKIHWIRILLITSQLFLIAFVFQWLAFQYREEKRLLAEELTREYFDSQQQVIDSLIVSKVVNPAIHIVHNSPSDSIETANAVVTISMPDSMKFEKTDSTFKTIAVRRQKDVLLRSVKLFISKTSDSTSETHGFAGAFPEEPDTLLFKDLFETRVIKKGFPLTFTWINQPDSLHLGSIKGAIVLGNPYDPAFPSAKIGKISPVILKEMTSQILFSLVLLLLTGSAFIITFRSLKKQMVVNALRNEFVGNISHELKTPVSTVKLALDSLRNPERLKDPEKSAEYLGMAASEMKRLENLVTKILDQSLLEEKLAPVELTLMDLNDLVASVLKGFELRISQEGATIEFDAGTNIPQVKGDPLYLNSVVVNLVDNSLKYASPKAEIRVRTFFEKGKVCLSVTDNGPGIPAEYHSKIFEKFYRIPGNNKHNVKGYGLGLTFAQQVMKQHGGSIQVANQPKGCTFTLSFPAPR
jgi:signal transduction histidine kinase